MYIAFASIDDLTKDLNLNVDMNALEKFMKELPEKSLSLGVRLALALLFLFVGTRIIKLIRKIVNRSMTKANADVGAIQFMDSFIKFALYIVLFFSLAQYFGLDTASVVALVGSAGVAIGLAIQGSLSNLAGGVLLLILKPFKVGDYIIEGSSGREGTVKEIQIFYTKLQTPDNKTVILPNGSLSNNCITNVTAADTRRLDIKIGISYDADIRTAKKTLQNVLDGDSRILLDKDHHVFVDELGASSVDLVMRCWVKCGDYWNVRAELNERAKYALDEAGISIPYTQIDVHLDK